MDKIITNWWNSQIILPELNKKPNREIEYRDSSSGIIKRSTFAAAFSFEEETISVFIKVQCEIEESNSKQEDRTLIAIKEDNSLKKNNEKKFSRLREAIEFYRERIGRDLKTLLIKSLKMEFHKSETKEKMVTNVHIGLSKDSFFFDGQDKDIDDFLRTNSK